MNKINRVKSEYLFPVIIELIQNNQKATITVTGNSMSPFLKEIRDRVELSATSFNEIKRGDIVLIRRKTGYHVMHRVYKKEKDCFFMVGDAQEWIEGPLYPDQLIAIVKRVWRKNREISCDNIIWKFLSLLWLYLRRYRYTIFKINKMFKQFKTKLSWRKSVN